MPKNLKTAYYCVLIIATINSLITPAGCECHHLVGPLLQLV